MRRFSSITRVRGLVSHASGGISSAARVSPGRPAAKMRRAIHSEVRSHAVMFTTAQTWTAKSVRIVEAKQRGARGRPMVLLVIAAVCAVAWYGHTWGVRLPSRSAPTTLGWMSEQWLAEYRASHPS